MTGTFYGVGVGPGDPELMTIKAVKVLKSARAIVVPRSRDTASGSQALGIAGKAVDLSGKEIIEIAFPMTKDADELRRARKAAAERIAGILKAGKDAAFITLGDPVLYSTFSYLIPFVKELLPDVDVRVIPGITSFSAAASALTSPIAEADETVAIIPAAYGLKGLEDALKAFDTVVIMKVNKVIDEVIGIIKRLGLSGNAFLVSKASLPDEEIVADIGGLKGTRPGYFSTLIVKKNRPDGKKNG